MAKATLVTPVDPHRHADHAEVDRHLSRAHVCVGRVYEGTGDGEGLEGPETSSLAGSVIRRAPCVPIGRCWRRRVHDEGMGFWVPRPTLDRGERVEATILANHTQGLRAVGGRLFVTDRNLRFVASRFDRIAGGEDITVARGDVESIEVADRSVSGGLFTGGLRRRLHLVTTDGGELFVVNRAEQIAERLRAWASKPPM